MIKVKKKNTTPLPEVHAPFPGKARGQEKSYFKNLQDFVNLAGYPLKKIK